MVTLGEPMGLPASGIVMGAHGDKIILHYRYLDHVHQRVWVPDVYIVSLVLVGIMFSSSS